MTTTTSTAEPNAEPNSSIYKYVLESFGGRDQFIAWLTQQRADGYSWDGICLSLERAAKVKPSEQTVIDWAKRFGLETGRVKRDEE